MTRRSILVRALIRLDQLLARLWLGVHPPDVLRRKAMMSRRARLLARLLDGHG